MEANNFQTEVRMKRTREHNKKRSTTELTIEKIYCFDCYHNRCYRRNNGDLVCARCKKLIKES